MTPARRWVVGVLAATLSIIAVAAINGPVEGQPAQPDVVIVGDSLTGGNASYIRPTLSAAGLDARVEGLSSRRIAVSFWYLGYRDSGIERIRSLRAAGVDPDLWVIQLGTNDLTFIANCGCPDRVAFAGSLIDRLLAELPPNRPVAWVTVMNRADFDITNTFNEALRRRAAVDPYVRLIDWAALSLMRPDWFIDAVHPNVTGLVRFTQLYVDEIRSLLAEPPGPPPTRPGVQRAVRLGAR
jgi:lysophospholipase L1-like esterase